MSSLCLYKLSEIIKNNISSKYKDLDLVNITFGHKTKNLYISAFNLAKKLYNNNNNSLLKYGTEYIEYVPNDYEIQNLCISSIIKNNNSYQVVKNYIIDINYIDPSLELRKNELLRLSFFSTKPFLISINDNIMMIIIFTIKDNTYIFESEIDFNNDTSLLLKNQKFYNKHFNKKLIPYNDNGKINFITEAHPFTIIKNDKIEEHPCNLIEDIISSYKYNICYINEKFQNDGYLTNFSLETPPIDFIYDNIVCKLGILQLQIDRSNFYFDIENKKYKLKRDNSLSNLIKSIEYTICDRSLSSLISNEYELFINNKIIIDKFLNLMIFIIIDSEMNIIKVSSAFMLNYPYFNSISNKCISLNINKENNIVLISIEENKGYSRLLEINSNDVRNMLIFDGESFSGHDINFSQVKPTVL
jgi:hypothetical protein